MTVLALNDLVAEISDELQLDEVRACAIADNLEFADDYDELEGMPITRLTMTRQLVNRPIATRRPTAPQSATAPAITATIRKVK